MNTVEKTTLNEILIRNKLMPGDLGYIAYIHGRLYAKECGYGLNFEAYVLEGLTQFAHEYEADRDKIWICEHSNKIIGFLVAAHREEAVQLRYFLFLPEYRGIGLGKKLMGEFIAFMELNNYKKAYLWTTNEQHSAIALYTQYGFILTEEKHSNAFDKMLVERRYDMMLN